MALQTDLLALAIQANQTTMLIGVPGIGKTEIVGAMVREIGEKIHGGADKFPFVFASLPQMAPEEFGGAQVPNHQEKMMEPFAMGSLLPIFKAKKGVFLGDEFGSAQASRAAFLTFAQSKQAGFFHVPGCVVVCCMNPPESGTAVTDLSPADSNRYFFLDWSLDPNQWDDYMLGGKGAIQGIPVLPNNWEKEHLPKVKAMIAGFRKRNPNSWLDVPKEGQANGPWASPRSWVAAARMLAAVRATGFGLESDHAYHAVEGCVGHKHAEAFMTWIRDIAIPDPELLLGDPKNCMKHMPDRHDRIIATLEAVAAAAVEERKDKVKRWEDAWLVLEHVFNTGKHDRCMSAAAMLCAQGRKPNGANFPTIGGKILGVRKAMGISDSGGNT